MTIGILGGGIAGLSLAYFLKHKSTILEREAHLGGLGRSFSLNGIDYDIGPHIIFSKNKEILDLHTSLLETNKIRRSNKILHKGKLIKYPFENDLASLDKEERDYCLHGFLNNPYDGYEPSTMLQFFLKTFGEGITKLYLEPYNEKIWKFDPSFLDTQMVERIPKPPKEDVIKSAQGIPTEGYTHQLYFHYPREGGFQALVNAYAKAIEGKSEIINPVAINKIIRKGKQWLVKTDKGDQLFDKLVNCMPLHELFRYLEAPDDVRQTLDRLKFNSIYTVVVQCAKDGMGDNFTFTIADKDVIFHRLSKLNFLGDRYCLKDGGSTLLIEITFRPDSQLAIMPEEDLKAQVVRDLEKLSLVSGKDILAVEARRFKYAYVIYDLHHKQNSAKVLGYLEGIGISCCGRFAEFKYMNSDHVAESAQRLAGRLNGGLEDST